MKKRKTILICALNWGLGHATRSMPIINYLLKKGHEVHLASDGEALALWKMEYPDLKLHTLTGYDVLYHKNNMVYNLAVALPKINKAITREKKEVKRLYQKYKYDIIISDNRYGCRNKHCHNVLITHQIRAINPIRGLDEVTYRIHQQFLARFDDIWVPDMAQEPGLSGRLGHKHNLRTVTYIGPLSRLKIKKTKKKYHWMVLLSGPEPQRTRLEEILHPQIVASGKKTIFISGSARKDLPDYNSEQIDHITFASSEQIAEYFGCSKYVICRGGYTTIMDLAVSGNKALLIPTPGQTEQLYLADSYFHAGYFLDQSQDKVDLAAAEKALPETTGLPKFDLDSYKKAIDKLIKNS